jgi:Bacterial Ig-like domain
VNNILHKYIFFFALVIASSCAQVRGLSGGEKDAKAPLVVSYSPANMSTYFVSKRVEIEFDEYVNLTNIQQELVVSPPMQTAPKVVVKHKSVIVSWKDALQPNTTYTFNFGDGVTDVNENNKAQDLKYIFSTGPIIDSLKIQGQVTDVILDAPAADYKILLFENDTTIFSKKPRPIYFTKTKKDGSFKIENMRPGEFHAYALNDLNSNYRWDAAEAIAFLNSPIILPNTDSTLIKLDASIPRLDKPIVSDYDTDSTGTIEFEWDPFYTPLTVYSLRSIPVKIKTNAHTDTVVAMLQGPATNSFEKVVVNWNNIMFDTLQVPFYSKAQAQPFLLQHNVAKKITTTDSIFISAKNNLLLNNKSNIILQEDSVPIPADVLENPEGYLIKAALKEGKKYDLQILSGSFVNQVGANNQPLNISFSTYKKEELGEIKLNILLPENGTKNVLVVTNKEGKKIIETKNITSGEIVLGQLLPGEYEAALLIDSNANGLFDPAVLKTKIATEKIYRNKTKMVVRANWEVKVDWDLSKN